MAGLKYYQPDMTDIMNRFDVRVADLQDADAVATIYNRYIRETLVAFEEDPVTSVGISVYLAPGHTGLGIGSKLYEQLFAILQDRGIHAAIGGIALPNDASVALHEKFGMKKVAHFVESGIKFDQWVDAGYWKRIL